MKALDEFTGTVLEWTRSSRRSYSLCHGSDTYATLEIERKGHQAMASAADGTWQLRWRRRFVRRHAVVLVPLSELPVGTCDEAGFGEGLIDLFRAEGARAVLGDWRFALVPAGHMRTSWTWQAEDGRGILTLARPSDRTLISVEPLLAAQRFRRQASLLAVLGWYVIQQWWPNDIS